MFLNSIYTTAQSAPHQVAIVEGTNILTYSQLYRKAKQISSLLVLKHIPPHSFIPILLPRGADYITALLGIMLHDCAYIPLSDDFPAVRREAILLDCNAPLVIDASFMLAASGVEPDLTFSEPQPESTVLAIYTSGSSGTPKGAKHSYANLCSYVASLSKEIHYSAVDKYGSALSFTFAGMFFDILFHLYMGVPIILVPEDVRKDPRLLQGFIVENHITSCIISPQLLKQMPLHKPMGALATVFTGSEKVSGIYSDCFKIFSLYGQGECIQAVSIFEIDKAYDNTPIGKPFTDISLYLLDDNLNPVPEETLGEICISGRVSQGYLNMPEETSRVFIPNPFREKDGHEFMFKSGDLGKLLSNGQIEYANRKDWMIKINGQRVEPGEVEVSINALKGIRQSVVNAVKNQSGKTQMCAYYLADEEKIPKDMIEELKEMLPAYMIPSYFVHLEAFPLNASNKIDRAALLPPIMDEIKSLYTAPSTPLELLFCQAFQEILNLEQVGIDDDFFALGGDSITAVQLCLHVEADLSDFLPLSAIYDGKSPKAIAANLDPSSLKYV